jgi:lipoprotein-anchoring transpeptidase ErfK/SrfK
VKLAAPILLIICSLAATQAFAEDAVPHPLTRAGCDKAGLVWNDNANVCDVAFGEAEAKPEAEVPVVSTGQPLTRKGCDLAGMHWNDFANVCDEKLVGETAEAKTTPTAPTILITIDKAAQTMTVSVDGKERYDWPVSTGRPAYSTPSGIFTPTSMNKIWYSKQWDNAPMPHAIFFTEKGHAIHGTEEVRRLGKPASHGCVRLSPQNAATLYKLVADEGLQNTEVVLTGLTPGRGAHAASSSAQKSQSSRARKGQAASSSGYTSQYSFAPGDKPEAHSKQRRGGLFRRLFGRR